jgi:hypothetical protein
MKLQNAPTAYLNARFLVMAESRNFYLEEGPEIGLSRLEIVRMREETGRNEKYTYTQF